MGIKVGDKVTIYPSKHGWWANSVNEYLKNKGSLVVTIVAVNPIKSAYDHAFVVNIPAKGEYRQYFGERELQEGIVTRKYMESPLWKKLEGIK